MTPDTRLIQATRAVFEDLLDESPLAPDWERVTGQIVPLQHIERRPRRRYAFAAAVVAAIGLIGATMFLYSGRLGTAQETVQEGDVVASGVQANVCDLFTAEEVTAIVRDAYIKSGVPVDELPTFLVENRSGTIESRSGSGSGDACDWLDAAETWVILERIPDGQHTPHWDRAQYYQAVPDDQRFEPNDAMPSGVGVDNVTWHPDYGTGLEWTWIVGIDVQMIEDAPQWWRFNLWMTYDSHDYGIHARAVAFDVASQMFETIQDNS